MAVAGLTSVVGIAAGGRHAVAVKDDGTVWTWGLNDYGQLGDGTTSTRLAPVQVLGLTGVVQAAAGFSHSLAVLSDGSVRSWGRNDAGQLGNGLQTSSPIPVPTQGLGTVTAVAGGIGHSLARRADGTVWAGAPTTPGQCGGAFTIPPDAGARRRHLRASTVVSAGWDFSAAVSVDGAAWVWGSNGSGQHGDGSPVAVASPRLLPGAPALTRLAIGVYHSLALDAGRRRLELGRGRDRARRGTASGSTSRRLRAVGGLAAATDIAAGAAHSLAVTTDGAVWTWGGTDGPRIPGVGGALQPW